MRKRLRLGPAALRRQPEPVALANVRHSLSIALSPRVLPQLHWQQQDMQQLGITAGQPLPEQLSFQLQQEDGQQAPEGAYAGVAATLSPAGKALPLYQLVCSVVEGWCRLQLQEGVRLTAAGDYDLRLVYREPRAELAELLPLGGMLHLPPWPRVGGAAGTPFVC
jgi:hypothetical protein